MPWLFIKGQTCQMFGWTFLEYDQQPTDEVLHYLSLKKVFDDVMESKRQRHDD